MFRVFAHFSNVPAKERIFFRDLFLVRASPFRMRGALNGVFFKNTQFESAIRWTLPANCGERYS